MKKQYDELLASEFTIIERNLENVNQQRILNKIKNAYNLSANERLDVFFSEIGLPIGEIERKAIKERNSMAHGDIMRNGGIRKMVRLTRAFQTFSPNTS